MVIELIMISVKLLFIVFFSEFIMCFCFLKFEGVNRMNFERVFLGFRFFVLVIWISFLGENFFLVLMYVIFFLLSRLVCRVRVVLLFV